MTTAEILSIHTDTFTRALKERTHRSLKGCPELDSAECSSQAKTEIGKFVFHPDSAEATRPLHPVSQSRPQCASRA